MSNFPRAIVIWALAALSWLAPPQAQADWRCDCTRITGSCDGSVTVRGNWVEVGSNVEACSRVDYYIDGQPFVTVVVDGEDRQDWVSRTADPKVLVKSCEVCQDNVLDADARSASGASAGAAAEAGDAAPAPDRRVPLVRVDPTYPATARARGVEGHVVVEFDVTASGNVTGPRVVEARPRGTFDSAALEAVQRWRFAPGADGEEMASLRERIEFRLPQGQRGTATRTDGRVEIRNSCVKEGYVYELVEMIEVQLINACSEPVVLYACTEGFGDRTGQWSCTPDGSDAVALVREGDPRDGFVGDLRTGLGALRYAYVDEQYLARPPATRYWWIACGVDDLDCHEAAMRWKEFLHLKPRGVNPARSSDIPVAASL